MAARSRTGLLLVAGSVLALGLSAFTSFQSRSFAECQAAVNEALIVAQTARADAAEQDRVSDREESQATADLIRSVFSAATREESRAAYDRYAARMAEIDARRAATDKRRQEHPLPAPPSQTCR